MTPAFADEICKVARVLPKAKPMETGGAIAETYDHTISSDENYGSVTLNGANSSVTSGLNGKRNMARSKELLNFSVGLETGLQAEVRRMLTRGLKCELEALADKDFQYLTEKYLLRKLKEKDWLD